MNVKRTIATTALISLLALGGTVALATDASSSFLGPSVPSGAVIAFDLPNGCPEGWSDFTEGQSLMIIGASFPNGNSTESDDGLSKYKFRQTGGKEQHALQIDEMPRHAHDVSDPGHRHRVAGGFSARDRDNEPGGGELTNGNLGRGDHHSTTSTSEITVELRGEGNPHPNLPPHIALYFCKKN